MELNIKTWQQLESEKQNNIVAAALIPPPISLDLWAEVTIQASVKILQLAESLLHSGAMQIYQPLGSGNYYFSSFDTIKLIIEWAEPQLVTDTVERLLDIFTTTYKEGPKLWMALAYICEITETTAIDLDILIKAAEYCNSVDLHHDAEKYYQLVASLVPPEPDNLKDKQTYVAAVIGSCLTTGKSKPYNTQKKLLEKGLVSATSLGDQNSTAIILSHLGQVHKALGNYDTAATMLDKAWAKASETGNEELIRRVVLASTDFLIWQGCISEAIERYEQFLGNLEGLPTDESSLTACAQLGWMYGKNGQIVRGIGLINLVLEKAEEHSFEWVIIFSKLAIINSLNDAWRFTESEPLVDELLQLPDEKLDLLFKWPLYAAKTYLLSSRGEYEEGFKMQQKAYKCAKLQSNLHHRGPINFEYMEILEEAGFVHPEMNYESEVNRVINWPDIYMQGVGYYYRAKRAIKNNTPAKNIHADLTKSIELLTQSGAKLDLAYTQILFGRYLLQTGEPEKAENLLKEAWKVLRFTNENIFPDDLKHLVIDQGSGGFLLEPLIELGENFGTIRSKRQLLNNIITLTLKLTGAERGAFFEPTEEGSCIMAASRNVEPDLFHADKYEEVLSGIEKVMGSGGEIVKATAPNSKQWDILPKSPGWQITYPVKLHGKVLGSFFLERSLSGSTLSSRVLALLKVISIQVAVALDNVLAYEKIAELNDQLEAETLFYRNEPSNAHQLNDIVGESTQIKEVISKIHDVAQSDTTVLIVGETGVGKELVAKAIHRLSIQANGPFIPVSIASLSESLLPSELFGHEKGAFTNAMRTHLGRFELAKNGTLFLDEVNSMSLDIQSKLLRVLEEKSFERVGGSSAIDTNFRLIAATNQMLDQAVEQGTFRSDLFYRLNVYPIIIPPLRQRKEDIPILISYFVEKFNQKFEKNFKTVNKNSMQELLAYPWPGNVRELKHSVERAILSCKEKQLTFQDLTTTGSHQEKEKPFIPLKDHERQYIIKALAHCNWRVSGKSGAAQLLGLKTQTLYSKIRRLGIKKHISADISTS